VLWSAKWEVIGVRVLASLLLGNVFHVSQREVAACVQVKVFDVSMDLPVRCVPHLLQRGLDPIGPLASQGRGLGVIRPSTRGRIQVPDLDWQQILWPPVDLVCQRQPRYAHNPGGHARRKKKRAS
jgi:hypothetical protein